MSMAAPDHMSSSAQPPVICTAAPSQVYGGSQPFAEQLAVMCMAAPTTAGPIHFLWQLRAPQQPPVESSAAPTKSLPPRVPTPVPVQSHLWQPQQTLPPGVPTPVASLTCCPLSGFTKSSMASLDDMLRRSIAITPLSLPRTRTRSGGGPVTQPLRQGAVAIAWSALIQPGSASYGTPPSGSDLAVICLGKQPFQPLY